MMKKFILRIGIILVVLGLPGFAFSQWDIRPGELLYNHAPGESFTIGIKLSGSGGDISTFGLDVSYPSALLQYDGGDFTGTLLEAWMFKSVGELDSVTLRAGGFTTTGIITAPAEGVFLKLNFTVKSEAVGEGDICLINFTDNLSEATTECSKFNAGPLAYWQVETVDSIYQHAEGESFTIEIMLSETGPDIDALGLDLHYPETLLDFISADFTGTLLNDWTFKSADTPVAGTVRVGGTTTTDTITSPAAGILAKLTFTVKTGATGKGDLTIDTFVDDLVNSTTRSGVFIVQITPTWRVPITITESLDSYTRTFGGHPDATDAFDEGLDTTTAPPGFDYYPYLEIPLFPNFLSMDIRTWAEPYDTEIGWTLKIVNAESKTSILSWNPGYLPLEGVFMMENATQTIQLDMRQHSSLTLDNSETLLIKYLATTTVAYEFAQQGWYMVSLPVVPDDNSLAALFPTALGAYAFNPVTRNYETVTALETKKGYWLPIPAATTVNITGKPMLTYTEHYQPGWHLAGSVLGGTDLTYPNVVPYGAISAVYSWDSQTLAYVEVYPNGLGLLEQTEGFWLGVAEECDLTIQNSGTNSVPAGKSDHQAFFLQYGTQPPPPPFLSEVELESVVPLTNELSYNYPNPFNPQTIIHYNLKKTDLVKIEIYNALGQKIRTLLEQEQPAGSHQILWDGRNSTGEMVTSGVYFYQISTAEFSATRKMMFLK